MNQGPSRTPQYPAMLLKLSGEALGGPQGFGIDPEVVERLCATIANIRESFVPAPKIALVLGGGNLFRGQQLAARGLDRVVGDRIGMMATIMNGLAFGDFLTRTGVTNRVVSAIPLTGMVQGYERDAVRRAMQDDEVVVLTGGIGNPFFTTDTAACLRAIELGCNAVLKATNVDGVYDADPKAQPGAKRFDRVSYDEVLARGLGVMDHTAIVLCKEHDMPLHVFDLNKSDALVNIVSGLSEGTAIVP